jgi:hypothetical protein
VGKLGEFFVCFCRILSVSESPLFASNFDSLDGGIVCRVYDRSICGRRYRKRKGVCSCAGSATKRTEESYDCPRLEEGI